MQLSNDDIGRTLYMVEPVRVDEKQFNVIYFGTLISIIPKYQFLDAFSSEYKRSQNYIFKVAGPFNQYLTKTTTSPDMVFEKIEGALNTSGVNSLFHYSVLFTNNKE